ncbi:hypothetical protein MKX01_035228 [Papaver californicum]|nr:hypothetical protein MKX01_035228 [Papaver californicum]
MVIGGAPSANQRLMTPHPGKARVVGSFAALLGFEKDYQITLTAFNMKRKTSPSFIVSKFPHNPGDQVYFAEPSREKTPEKHETEDDLPEEEAGKADSPEKPETDVDLPDEQPRGKRRPAKKVSDISAPTEAED